VVDRRCAAVSWRPGRPVVAETFTCAACLQEGGSLGADPARTLPREHLFRDHPSRKAAALDLQRQSPGDGCSVKESPDYRGMKVFLMKRRFDIDQAV
jgi:hypothetical protein